MNSRFDSERLARAACECPNGDFSGDFETVFVLLISDGHADWEDDLGSHLAPWMTFCDLGQPCASGCKNLDGSREEANN